MNLDFSNNNNKKDDTISNFINELKNFLEQKTSKNLKDYEKKDISILEETENNYKITAMYRDKMHIERNNILNKYAENTQNQGKMYYIYNKDLQDNIYHLSICEKGKEHNVIKIQENELPTDVGVDSILREENGKYKLDIEATKEISKQLQEMVSELLNEQKEYLESQRIENHIYEVGEKKQDRVWLYDITKNDGNGIEEIDFPLELLDKVEEGTKIKYEDDNYQICK